MKKFFNKFIKERWYLHVIVGIIISVFFTPFALAHMQFTQVPLWFAAFVNFLINAGLAFVREGYYAEKKMAVFSWSDIFASGIGGIIGYILYLVIT